VVIAHWVQVSYYDDGQIISVVKEITFALRLTQVDGKDVSTVSKHTWIVMYHEGDTTVALNY